MAISAQVINGKVYADYTSGTSTNKDTKGSDSLDKDAFLKNPCGRNAISGST